MIKTRFAPSPTGHLHIGGVRTAIFNWAFARHYGGNFYLRIDDTDSRRHVDGATEKIIESFKWLGLDYDPAPETMEQGLPGNMGSPSKTPIHYRTFKPLGPSGIVYQSLRGFSYIGAVRELVNKGLVYNCFCTPEQLQEDKRKLHRYSGRCRNLSQKELENNYAKGIPSVYRVNVDEVVGNLDSLTFTDEILGEVSRPVQDIGDFVVMKYSGAPLYSLATVVDDHDMGITHVVRGQEHLSNTYPQLILYAALDYNAPHFAHLPFICAENSTKKLSKRDAEKLGMPVTLADFDRDGYLPEAIFNYLSHLGWALDGETEIWSREELVKNFSLAGCLRKPAQLDLKKLEWMEGEYMSQLPFENRLKGVLSQYPDLADEDLVGRVVRADGHRMKKFSDINRHRHFFDDETAFRDSLSPLPADCEKKLRKNDIHQWLEDYAKGLAELDPWNVDGLERYTKFYCEAAEIKLGDLVAAVRVATTGQTIGFGLYDGMEILGRKKCLDRIDYASSLLRGEAV